MIYRHPSPAGLFEIQPLPDGRWRLSLRGEALGTHPTARAAAACVHSHDTGDAAWDAMAHGPHGYSVPEDLAEWSRLS